MQNNLLLAQSLSAFMRSKDWILKSKVENKVSIWSDKESCSEVVIPEPHLIDHPQSSALLTEAIQKLSNYYQINFDQFIEYLSQGDSDVFKVRVSGENVETGKVPLSEGVGSYIGILDLVKFSARNCINVKGKRQYVNDYLDGISMLAPQAGSFIYVIESDLIDVVDSTPNQSVSDLMSLGRYVNIHFAKQLEKALRLTSDDQAVPAHQLLQSGIDLGFCENFLKVFSKRAENVDFDFSWSLIEDVPNDIPRRLSFGPSNRAKLQSFREILKKSEIKKYMDLPACIERYSWPRDSEEGKITTRITLGSSDYVCSFVTKDENTYEKIKSLKARKSVFITADIVRTSGRKTSVGIAKLYQIRLSPQDTIEL